MSGIPSEHVLVVPTQLLHQLGYFQGFSPRVQTYIDALLDPENTSYRTRDEMEQDPNFKQLIPYVIFCHRPDNEELSVFRYTRGTGQGEQRLHRKKSVGIGGHIASHDGDRAEPYTEGMRRELEEEVAIRTSYADRCVGLINDDETDVGRVHLGVVHLFEVKTPDVYPRETEIMDAGFQPVSTLLARLDGFESWSRICLEALFANHA
ncbi:MAG: phosphoesterase [Pirellulaceae bacterium]